MIIVGLNNAGKTTTLYKLYVLTLVQCKLIITINNFIINFENRLLDEVVVTNPTIGSNVEEVNYKNIKFLMWDIGGQESTRASWANYYAGTDVCQFRVPFRIHNLLQARLSSIKQ